MTVKELIAKVKEAYPKATGFMAEYSGSGDEGNVNSVSLLYGEAEADFDDDVLEIEVYDFTDELLNEHCGGYGENEGGCGQVIYDIAIGKATIEYAYYETITTDQPDIVVE